MTEDKDMRGRQSCTDNRSYTPFLAEDGLLVNLPVNIEIAIGVRDDERNPRSSGSVWGWGGFAHLVPGKDRRFRRML